MTSESEALQNEAPQSEALIGRNRISARAIRAVVSAITAAQLHVPASEVRVELGDVGGSLSVTVSAPIEVAALTPNRANNGPSRATNRGPTILDRASDARNTVFHRLVELTGSTVVAVTLRLTEARIREGARVL